MVGVSDEVFYMNSRSPSYAGLPIGYALRRRGTKGEVGLEVECEGNKFNKSMWSPRWVYHKDGSLRGKDNAEYVLSNPLSFDEAIDEVRKLYDMFKEYGTVLDDSNRTSVHVHLNVQEWYMNRFASFCALWFSCEEILTAWCGEARVGNLFCLRGKDAPAIVSRLRRFVERDGDYKFSEGLHYGGLNAHALQKFGSIEVRTMRGTTDPDTLITWLNVVRRLYDLSAEFKDPRDIMGLFSSEGPTYFLQSILGDYAGVIRNNVPYTEDQVRDAMFEGIRLAQQLCYCRDWGQFQERDRPEEDVFGRITKKPQTLQEASQIISASSVPDHPWANTAQFVAYNSMLHPPMGSVSSSTEQNEDDGEVEEMEDDYEEEDTDEYDPSW